MERLNLITRLDLGFAAFEFALRAHDLPAGQTGIHVDRVAARRLVDLNTVLDHFGGQDLVALLLTQRVKLLLVLVLQVQHVIQTRFGDARPADDLRPVGKASAVRERAKRKRIVHVLQLFLRCESLLHQVGVEAAEAKDEDAEEDGDEGTNHTGPVLLEDFKEDFSTSHILIVWVVSDFVEV